MKAEKAVVLAYTFIGISLGAISSYIGNLYLALIIPFAVYAVTLPVLMKLVTQKKKKFLTSSFVSFVLWWLVVWILLINI